MNCSGRGEELLKNCISAEQVLDYLEMFCQKAESVDIN